MGACVSSSIYQSLNRVRKPRVHITLDIETNGAEPVKELPFVVGVMGDFSGDAQTYIKDADRTRLEPVALKPLSERKFVQIDRDNFDKVMASMTPGLNLEVEDTLARDGNKNMKIALAFQSIDDFDPARVAEQVPELKALLDARNKLRDLMIKADRSQELEALLEKVLQEPNRLDQLSSDLGKGKAD